MTETLFIRLGSMPHDIIHWLIWSNVKSENNEDNIIASGQLSGANDLSSLSEKSTQRKVIALVSSCDVALKSLFVPGKSQKAMQLAAPYMLEDDLAQDVEQLFFAYGKKNADPKSSNNCFIAAVEHQQIQTWQRWLQDAGISCKTMIPDVLAMPYIVKPLDENNAVDFNESWSAINLGEQVILRQGPWQGMVVDQQIWPIIYQQLNQIGINEGSEDSKNAQRDILIHAFSTLPTGQVTEIISEHYADKDNVTVKAMPEELPLALFAQQIAVNAHQGFNLLQGKYKLKEQKSPILKSWFWAAAIASLAVVLNIGIKAAELMQLNAQQQAIEANIIASYKKAFPASKRVRVSTVKSQLKRKMAELGSTSSDAGFLAMLAKLEPAFSQVSALKPESIKFDSKRQEIRLQAIAKDYQAFDQFKNSLEKVNLTVKQGAQNNQGDVISGSFSITDKGSSNTKGARS
jgi:general secretion pathway protein L